MLFATTHGSPIPTATYDLQARYVNQPCNELDRCRTKANIVLTCLITVLACTWISVRPNIPSPDDSKPKVALRRVGIIICALIAPELVVLWAMRQRVAARKLAKGKLLDAWIPVRILSARSQRELDTISWLLRSHGRIHDIRGRRAEKNLAPT